MSDAEAGKLIDKRIAESRHKFLAQTGSEETYAIIWNGYLAAGMEWKVIGINEFRNLFPKLPKVVDEPTSNILVGRSDPDVYD